MTRAAFAPLIGREYYPFLTASLGEEPGGMRLSVLSALARSDLDPWVEASLLAKMPREKAALRLAAFISAIPERPAANIAAETIADNLVALLPKANRPAPQGATELSRIMATSSARSNYGLGLSAIALLVALVLMAIPGTKPRVDVGVKAAAAAEQMSQPLPAVGQ